MKFAPLFATALLTLGSCAPKAIVLSEGFNLNLSNQQDAPAVAATTERPRTEAPAPTRLPTFKPQDGLLDPSGLTTMPADRDIKTTVDKPTSSAVIAKPPEQTKPTSE